MRWKDAKFIDFRNLADGIGKRDPLGKRLVDRRCRHGGDAVFLLPVPPEKEVEPAARRGTI